MALSLTIINSNPCRDLLVLYCNQIWHNVRRWRPKNWFLNWHTIQIQKQPRRNPSVFLRYEIKLGAKVQIYQALICIILLYSRETWPRRTSDLRKLEVLDHQCLCHIIRVHWQQVFSNASVCSHYKIFFLQQALFSRRLHWFHCNPDVFIYKAVESAPPQSWKKMTWKTS